MSPYDIRRHVAGRAGETLVVALCVALWLWMLFTRIDQ